MKTWSFDSPDPEATRRIALQLGRVMGADGLVIGLIGPLGAGKTVFVKGLAEGLGIEPAAVSSPTFVIAQQYSVPQLDTPRPHWLHHVDLYRLESEEELESMGFSDLFDIGSLLAVEWADRFPNVLGPERLEIELEGPSLGEATRGGRRARVRAIGPSAETALEDWKECVERTRSAAASTGGSAAGGGTSSVRPQQRVSWLLILALLLYGIARSDSSVLEEVCVHPVSVEEDLLGTSHVVCGTAGDAASVPTGVGGLLYGEPLDLAVVSARQLETLPGIGPARASAIVEARGEAPFVRMGDLARVSGIGPKTILRISPWLAVHGVRDGDHDGG